MKKIILLLSILFIGAAANAQTPNYKVAPDFTVTDINGVDHHLYEYLDQGKTVILDIFATWCGPCWAYSKTGALETIHNSYGPGGTDEIVVIAIEVDPTTGMSDLEGVSSAGASQPTQGDWITGTSYPIVNQSAANAGMIDGMFNVDGFPSIVVICPDRFALDAGQPSAATLYQASGLCPQLVTNANDPKIIGNNSAPLYCLGTDLIAGAVLQNYGTAPLTAATIELKDGNTTLLTKEWTGNLASYEYETIVFGNVSPTALDVQEYTVVITSANDDTSNDEVTIEIPRAPVLRANPADKKVVVDITFDNYASDFGLIFDSGFPVNGLGGAYNDAADGVTSPRGFVPVGTYADGSGVSDVIELSTTVDGCHYIGLLDINQDGLGNGSSISLSGNDPVSDVFQINPAYGTGTYLIFDLQSYPLGVKELSTIASNLFPNPVNNQDAVLELTDVTGEVVIRIVDITGKLVNTQKVTTNGRIVLPTQNLNPGVYIVNVSNNEGSTTQKLIVE